jgi:hypothetical protein
LISIKPHSWLVRRAVGAKSGIRAKGTTKIEKSSQPKVHRRTFMDEFSCASVFQVPFTPPNAPINFGQVLDILALHPRSGITYTPQRIAAISGMDMHDKPPFPAVLAASAPALPAHPTPPQPARR